MERSVDGFATSPIGHTVYKFRLKSAIMFLSYSENYNMPLYEYKCSKCHSVFEVIQKVGAPPLNKCLKCGASVHKVISPPALQFKGSGWYITDYAQKDRKKATTKKTKKSDDAPAKKTPPSTPTK